MTDIPTEKCSMKEMIIKCCKKWKCCPLAAVVVGIILFFLGYFLDAEVVRTLWLICAVLWIAAGIGCFLLMRCEKSSSCGCDKKPEE